MFSLDHVTLIYDIEKEDKIYALKDVTCDLPDHGLIGIAGPSGSGKSTMMYCLSTLKKPTSGTITYRSAAQNISYPSMKKNEQEQLRRNEFGFVFQRHFLISYMSALDNVILAAQKKSTALNQKAKELLLQLGLKERDLHKKPQQLSGGQRQRVAIARSLMNDPNVIFADEPTASLDHATAFQTMAVFEEYAKTHLVLVITHDRSILKNADQIIELWDGALVTESKEEA